MKKFIRRRTVVVIVAIIAAGFLLTRISGNKETETQVQTTQVERGTIVSSISASGQILTSNITNINTSASGTVKKVYVTDGQIVKAGDKIAEIELDQTGKLNQTKAYSSYLSAKNSLTSAETSYWTLQSAMFSANQKFINDAVARELDETDPTYIEEHADWLAAEAKFNSNKTDIDVAKQNLSSSWLSYLETSSTITAPTSGTINSIAIAEGMNVGGSDSSQKVATIFQEGTPLATVNVSEIDVTQIKQGQKVTITLDSITDQTFTGKIVSVDRVGTTTNNVTNYPVIIKFDTGSEKILPNMAVTANIIIDSKSDVLLAPYSAVSYQGSSAYVTEVHNGQQISIPVEVGISSDTQIEIVSGVDEGTEILSGSSTTTTSNQSSEMRGGGGSFMFMGR